MRQVNRFAITLTAVATGLLLLNTIVPRATQAGAFADKSKAITIIVAYPAGGGTDITGRLVAPMLEKELGVPVQVVNKPGAGGQVGFTELSRSKPDGYTIGYLTLPTIITTYLDPDRKAIFGPKSFGFLAMQDNDPGILAVKASSPYKTLKDLVADAKANPGKIRTTTAGILSDDHIAALMTQQMAKVKLSVVHFDGSAPGRTAVLGGHVEAFYGNASEIIAQVKGGEFRVISVFDKQRSKFYPEVMTAQEEGFPIFSNVYRGFGTPAGTPKEGQDVLSKALGKIISSEEFNQKMASLGYEPFYLDPEKYASFWAEFEATAKNQKWVEMAKEK